MNFYIDIKYKIIFLAHNHLVNINIDCINRAAVVYHVPATVILSVIKKEGGRNGDANKNRNGTVDYGVMQINSIWLPKLAAYGYTQNDIQYNACKNVGVGTWILSQSIASNKSVWIGIGNYHSKTPVFNKKYRASIYEDNQKLLSAISTK